MASSSSRDFTIAVDFDGTIVSHAYPEIGADLGGIPVLKELQERGYQLILYSMRSGRLLREAVEWCQARGLKFRAVNENPDQKSWTDSPKVHADLYIDDSALGCPIKFLDDVPRPAVDWKRVREQLERDGLL